MDLLGEKKEKQTNQNIPHTRKQTTKNLPSTKMQRPPWEQTISVQLQEMHTQLRV